jgi:hypothetical protein
MSDSVSTVRKTSRNPRPRPALDYVSSLMLILGFPAGLRRVFWRYADSSNSSMNLCSDKSQIRYSPGLSDVRLINRFFASLTSSNDSIQVSEVSGVFLKSSYCELIEDLPIESNRVGSRCAFGASVSKHKSWARKYWQQTSGGSAYTEESIFL